MIGGYILSFCNMNDRRTFGLSAKECNKISQIPLTNTDSIMDRKFVEYMIGDKFNMVKYRNIKHLV